MLTKLLPCLAAVVAMSGCSKPEKADYTSMFSFWTVTSAEQGGKPAESAFVSDVFIDSEIQDADGSADIDFRWTDPPRHGMKIDASKSPKQVDISEGTELGKGATWPGIYELNGDDLKLCFDLDGKTRPTEFKTKDGDKCLLLVLKRKKL